MTTSKARRLSSEQRQEAILTAAGEVFAEHGYQRGTAADIAARLGVTTPVIFQNFGTKAALYRAVLERLAGNACGVLAAVEEHGGSVSSMLASALSPEHVAEFHRPGSFGAVFADAASLIDDRDVGAAAREAIRRLAEALTDLLAYGQRSGDVHGDVDAAAAAWWIMSLLTARTFRFAIAADPAAVERRLAEMTMRLIRRD